VKIEDSAHSKSYSLLFIYAYRSWLFSGYTRPSAGLGEDGMSGHQYIEKLTRNEAIAATNSTIDTAFQNVRMLETTPTLRKDHIRSVLFGTHYQGIRAARVPTWPALVAAIVE
jgi:hypothetical protein